MAVSLRPFQADAVAQIRGAYMAGQRRVLFVLPTGGGKTYTFVHIAEQAAIRGNRVCIVVHRQELVDQASRSLHAIGCRHGIIAAGYRQDLSHTVQVASVQTLARRLHKIPPSFFQLLIIDEAHHAVAGTWARVLDHHQNGHVLGVTATPERLDGRGLGHAFDVLIEGPNAAWLTNQGFLVPARIFSPPGIDLSGIRSFDTAKGRHDSDAILRQGQAMGDAVSHYRRTIEPVHNGTAIAFCCSVDHADALAESFRSQSIPAARLDGSMDRSERRRIINDLDAGVLKVLTSCDIISEGTDIPSVTGAILLRPTDSLGLHLQQVGRVLRPAPGKTYAIINDHVGNSLRHGLPTDPRKLSLEGRQKRKRAASETMPVKVCPKCFATIASQEPVCPICQFEFPAPARRELIVVDGELQELQQLRGASFKKGDSVELFKDQKWEPGWVIAIVGKPVIGRTGSAVTAVRLQNPLNDDDYLVVSLDQIRHCRSTVARQKRNEIAKARTREELEAIRLERGYSRGWTDHMLRARLVKQYENCRTLKHFQDLGEELGKDKGWAAQQMDKLNREMLRALGDV